MATIELKQVEKRFDDFEAVKPLDLTIENGEFVVLLGPSGCGKTTTLRMISGLESVSTGTILLGEKDVTWLHPRDRNVAFVFQFYALYPHMNAYQNIAFPLQAEGMDSKLVEARVKEVVELLRIQHLLRSRPGKLSGGDQQRVALARALVRQPEAFLMDEPLGALDAEYREAMRAEIKRLHIDQNATTVYVTHDQVEAMAMGDRIVVMSAAEIQQVGSPTDVYYDPSNLFVAQFIGSPGMNLIPGAHAEGVIHLPGENRYSLPEAVGAQIAQSLNGAGEVILGFRPESVQIDNEGPLSGEVYATDLHGAYSMLHVRFGEDSIVHIRESRDESYPIGSRVRFGINPEMVRFFDPETETAIHWEAIHG